jgi:hypothetical protein
MGFGKWLSLGLTEENEIVIDQPMEDMPELFYALWPDGCRAMYRRADAAERESGIRGPVFVVQVDNGAVRQLLATLGLEWPSSREQVVRRIVELGQAVRAIDKLPPAVFREVA